MKKEALFTAAILADNEKDIVEKAKLADEALSELDKLNAEFEDGKEPDLTKYAKLVNKLFGMK